MPWTDGNNVRREHGKVKDKLEKKLSRISPEIYGHFSEHLGRCIYEGIYVGENSPIENVNGMRKDVVDALKAIHVPVLRWPGGCFADEYHWEDGIGPREKRKTIVNTHWGGVVEDNSFGTHEYFELCRQLGCKTYVNGNLGSGTVREMSEWVEYMTFQGVSPMAKLRGENGHEDPWRVDYFGVGNENWGCGGNMTPEYYANEYRRYQTYVRDYAQKPMNPSETHAPSIRKICCGANVDDYEWTRGVLETCFRYSAEGTHGYMDGLSLHYYVHPEGWKIKGSATEFDDAVWYKTLNKALYMEELIRRHGEIMDEYDPDREIALIVDEWGTWFTVEPGTNPGFLYQQNTMRDALVAGITLNIFNKHSDRVRMANIAQMVNVLQAVILTEGERMVKTPTYHIFDMYQCHQDACLVESELETGCTGTAEHRVPKLTESVSVGADGRIHITVTNLSLEEASEIDVQLDVDAVSVTGELLAEEMHAMNTFDEPDRVKIREYSQTKKTQGGFQFTLPPCSVIHLAVETA